MGAFEEDEIIAVGVVVGWGSVSGVLSGSWDVGGTSGFGDTVGDDGGVSSSCRRPTAMPVSLGWFLIQSSCHRRL